MRAVVVGASSGLGRCLAVWMGQHGDQVAMLGRRFDRVSDAAAEAGNGAFAVRCDATDQDSARAAIAEAAERLGGIDALVYTPGIGPLARLVDLDAGTWHRAFDTNVLGAALVTAAAIPHLTASQGAAAYLSSVSASMTPPWPGLGAYAVTKAALDTLIEAWRAEHPDVGFTRVVVGDCAGGEGPAMTEFANQWDFALAAELHPEWQRRNLLAGALVDVSDRCATVSAVLHLGPTACVPSVAVVPRPGPGVALPDDLGQQTQHA
jgi:NAD(P)-dependent dehydrogenase (short-subunit alcohol dehydrogenase family)